MKMLGLVPVDKMSPNAWNTIEIPSEDRDKLKGQMKISGPEKTEPVVVRRVGDGWEIIDGEKRWRTAKELGWTHLPAVEVDVSVYEAKKYCLSYNLLRGTVNFVALGELLVKDEEMVRVCNELLGKDKTERLMQSTKLLTPEAEQHLKQGAKEGAAISIDKIEMVAKTPKQHQSLMAKAAKKKTEITYLQSVADRLVRPKIEEPPKEEEKQKREIKEQFGKAVEAVNEFKCRCGQGYAAFYDREKKAVLINTIDIVGTSKVRKGVTATPKIFRIELRCDCGKLWSGEIDAQTGEYRFQRQG